MRKFEETEEYKKGKNGERIVKKILQEMGWKIIPSSDYTKQGAPRLEGEEGFIAAIPDLDASKNGTRRWVEVKAKDHREFFKKWRRNIHGISLRHFNGYHRIQKETGTPVWLFIYEISTNNILCASLDELSRPCWNRIYQGENEQDRGGNIYFDIAAFRLFGIPPSGNELFELRDRSWLPNRYMKR